METRRYSLSERIELLNLKQKSMKINNENHIRLQNQKKEYSKNFQKHFEYVPDNITNSLIINIESSAESSLNTSFEQEDENEFKQEDENKIKKEYEKEDENKIKENIAIKFMIDNYMKDQYVEIKGFRSTGINNYKKFDPKDDVYNKYHRHK